MLELLYVGFEQNKSRHPDVPWETVEALLCQDTGRLSKVSMMEQSGGEPDVMRLLNGFETDC